VATWGIQVEKVVILHLNTVIIARAYLPGCPKRYFTPAFLDSIFAGNWRTNNFYDD
jgi:hypothetical protein